MAGEVTESSGGGGGAGGGAGGAPPPPPPGGGTGGGAGSSGSSGTSAGGAGGAPPVRQSGEGGAGGAGAGAGPKYLERKVTRDGKEHVIKATEDALFTAFQREQATMRRAQELEKKEQEAAAAAERQRLAAEARKAKPLRDRIREELGEGADPIEALASMLEEEMKQAERSKDPTVREAMKYKSELEQLRAEKADREAAESRAAFARQVEAELEALANEFTPALKASKLPKNDITMELMAKARATAKRDGLSLDANTLAQAQHKAASEMVDSMVDGLEDPEEALEMFPKLTRKIHEGLTKRHKRQMASGQGTRVPAPDPSNRQPQKEDEAPKPRVLNSAEEHKAYHGNKKVLRSL
jgi:hypothetical protein